LAFPMNSLDVNFFQALASIDLVKNYISKVDGIIMGDNNSFTFSAKYLMKQESKFYNQSGFDDPSQKKEYPYYVPANVKIIFEPSPGDTAVEDLFRFKMGALFATQSCMPYQHQYYSISEDNAEMLGMQSPHDQPYHSGIQKFYEQSINLLELNISSEVQDWQVTILVTEGVLGTLDVPVKQFIPDVTADDLVAIIMSIASIADSLHGMKNLHGDISLQNIGLVQKMLRNGQVVIRPRLFLLDSMVSMATNISNHSMYFDNILRYNPNFRAPWIEQTARLANDQRTTLYLYSPDGKEDAFALWICIFNFINLNGLQHNYHAGKILRNCGKYYPNSNTYEGAPNLEQLNDVIISSLKESKFIQRRILI